jgi:hypothetical protein
MKLLNTVAAVLSAAALLNTASALEPRMWVVLDGRVIEGTLQAVSGNLVTILDKDARKVQLDKSFLGIGDNEYIKENFPDQKAGASAVAAVALPQPAKAQLKTGTGQFFEQKTFKLGTGTFSLPTTSFDIMETTHFKVMYVKPTDPKDCGELAERMWIDAAFSHEKFQNLWVDGKKMSIFLAPDDSTYNGIGAWYAELLDKAGQKEQAAKIGGQWPQSAGAQMRLTRDICEKYGVIEHARVFRAYRKGNTANAKDQAIKGVWTPFFCHCLAADMIDLQAPGTSDFGAKGYFALTTGHAYYKEVFLCGKSETGLLRSQSATGRDVSTARGLDDARQWAGELKKWVRKGEMKATFETLNLLTREGTDPKGLVLAYGWARYLQSSIPRMTAFSKLVERIGSSRQVPEPEDFAKFYGFNTAAEMEADFQKWIASTEFR